MIRINLLAVRAIKKKESTRQMFSVLLLSIGLLVGIIVFFHLSQLREISAMDAQIAAYNEESRRLRLDTKDINKHKAEKEDYQRRLNKIHDLQRAKTGPVRVLDELAIALPGKL